METGCHTQEKGCMFYSYILKFLGVNNFSGRLNVIPVLFSTHYMYTHIKYYVYFASCPPNYLSD